MGGQLFANVVIDHDQPPTTVIKTTDHFHVLVHWHITGTAATTLGGDFTVKVFAESIGPGPEVQLGSVVVPVSAAPSSLNRHYQADIFVNPNTLQEGPYKLVSAILYSNGGIPGNIAGVEEGPTIQVYVPHPGMP
jgi:hypothetical protein